MDKLVVNGSLELKGSIDISGAKNAVLPLMAATLLTKGLHKISRVPDLKDTQTFLRLLEMLGAKTNFNDGELVVESSNINSVEAPYELVQKMRASIIILGPLLARKGEAKIAFPGGDELGPRPVQMHLDALEKMGAHFTLDHGVLTGRSDGLKGVEINLPYASVGATENTLLAAVLAEGKTVIENAAREPEVVDLVEMLKKMGAEITGAGTSEITIEGVKKLNPTNHEVVGDRIAAGTFLSAFLATHGSGIVRGINPENLPMEIKKFKEIGAEIKVEDNSIEISYDGNLNAVELSTLPFPGVATDLQPVFGALLLKASGTSIITENVYDQRFQWIPEVQRMGASVQTGWQHAMIKGVNSLSGAPVNSTDIRTGASLVIAALQADGSSKITGIEHINRGYEDIVASLNSLGSKIEYN